MADATVDQLAIKIAVSADKASASLEGLITTLGKLNAVLAPGMKNLRELGKVLNSAKDAAPALKVAMKAASAATKEAGGEAKAAKTNIKDLSQTFRKLQNDVKSGTTPAKAALGEMTSIASKTNAEILKLRVLEQRTGKPIAYKQAETTLARMRAETDALRRSMATLPPVVDKTQASYQKYRQGLTAFQNTSKRLVDPKDLTNFDAQMKNATAQLGTMRTSLNNLAREMGTSFDSPALSRYISTLTAAQNRLDRLTAAHQKYAYAAKWQVIQASPAPVFPSTPFTNLGAQAASAAAGPIVPQLARVNTLGEKVKSTVGRVTTSLKEMGTTGSKHTKLLGDSFIQLRSKVFFLLFTLGVLAKAFDTFIGSASEYTEKMHLFGAVFGPLGEAANEYVQSITSVLGIDPMKFGESYSTFYSMAAAMGVSSEAANKLSQNYTQLVHDYASLRDMDFEEVAVKFRSALAGQTRSIIQFGLDITQASLQQELYREGINAEISTLTKAEKAIVAHNLIMRQTAFVQGDLARTITQPANMLRILKDQFIIAARAIGQLFMPVLQAVLPWLIALAMGIAKVAQAIAGLFGIKAQGWEDFASDISAAAGGTDDLYGGMEDVAGAAGGAADAAKKLKDYILGIDELNVLAPPEPTSGGGGGGAGGGGGGIGGLEPFDVYDMIGGMEGLKTIVQPVIDKFKEFLGTIDPFVKALGRFWEALKPFAQNVWEGFTSFYKDTLVPLAAWTMNTVGVAVLDSLTWVLEWFNDHPRAAKALGEVAGALIALKIGLAGLKGVGKIIGGLSKLFGITKLFDIIKGFLGGAAWSSIKIWIDAHLIAPMLTWFAGLPALLGGGIGSAFATLGSSLLSGLALVLSFGVGFLIGELIKMIPGVEEALEKFGTSLGNLYFEVSEWVKGAVETIGGWWDNLKTWTKTTWDDIVSWTTKAWSDVSTAVENAVTAVGEWIETAWSDIQTWTAETWNNIKTTITNALEKAWAFIRSTFDTIRAKVVSTWTTIKDATSVAWNWIKQKVETPLRAIWTSISTTFNNIKAKVKEVWNGLPDGLDAAWGMIKSIFKNGVNAILRTINNGPIKMINTLISGAKNLPGIGKTMGALGKLSTIPYVARGTTALSTGQLFIAGESGPELIGSYGGNPNTVMPLENSGFVEAMGTAVYRAMVTALAQEESGRGKGDIYMDGQRVGEIIQQGARRSGVAMSLVKRGV